MIATPVSICFVTPQRLYAKFTLSSNKINICLLITHDVPFSHNT